MLAGGRAAEFVGHRQQIVEGGADSHHLVVVAGIVDPRPPQPSAKCTHARPRSNCAAEEVARVRRFRRIITEQSVLVFSNGLDLGIGYWLGAY